MQNSGMITKSTKLPFGQHKGKKLGNCPKSYLQWVVANLWDSDLQAYAMAAKKILNEIKADSQYEDIEQDADAFLRSRGIDPRKL